MTDENDDIRCLKFGRIEGPCVDADCPEAELPPMPEPDAYFVHTIAGWRETSTLGRPFYSMNSAEAIGRACYEAGLRARQAPAPVEVSKLAEEIRLKTLEAAARACEKLAEERFNDYGTREPDTGACYYGGRVEEEYQTRDEEDDECAKAIRALAIVPAPRFPMTYCSQCGSEQGPGDEGVSHCSDHRVNRLAAARNAAAAMLATTASTPASEVPAGWVLVPRTLTRELLCVWYDEWPRRVDGSLNFSTESIEKAWAAFLAIATKGLAS